MERERTRAVQAESERDTAQHAIKQVQKKAGEMERVATDAITEARGVEAAAQARVREAEKSGKEGREEAEAEMERLRADISQQRGAAAEERQRAEGAAVEAAGLRDELHEMEQERVTLLRAVVEQSEEAEGQVAARAAARAEVRRLQKKGERRDQERQRVEEALRKAEGRLREEAEERAMLRRRLAAAEQAAGIGPRAAREADAVGTLLAQRGELVGDLCALYDATAAASTAAEGSPAEEAAEDARAAAQNVLDEHVTDAERLHLGLPVLTPSLHGLSPPPPSADSPGRSSIRSPTSRQAARLLHHSPAAHASTSPPSLRRDRAR